MGVFCNILNLYTYKYQNYCLIMERIDREYAIIYVDKTGESLVNNDSKHDEYSTNEIISDYYKQSGFLQWNFYLIIAREAITVYENEKIDDKIKSIESNEFYCRKYVIESEKINDFIAKNFPVLQKEHGVIILIKGDSYQNAKNLGYKEYIKPENKLNAKVINSWYRNYNSMYALTEMDKLRAELINKHDKRIIFVTHNSHEFSLAEKKFKLFKAFIEYEDKGDNYEPIERQFEGDEIKIRLYCEHKNCKKFILGVEGYNGSFTAETGQYADLRNQGWFCYEHRPKDDYED